MRACLCARLKEKEKREKKIEGERRMWIISSVRSRDRKKKTKKNDDIFGDASLLLVPSERCMRFFSRFFYVKLKVERKNIKERT